MLAYTSCLFATVALHAYHVQDGFYHHLFLALLTTSLLHRAHPDSLAVLTIDTLLAHAAFVACLMDWERVVASGHYWLGAFPVAVAVLWATDEDEIVHGMLHVTSVVGMHCWLAFLGPK